MWRLNRMSLSRYYQFLSCTDSALTVAVTINITPGCVCRYYVSSEVAERSSSEPESGDIADFANPV